jgi:hypothetical protein
VRTVSSNDLFEFDTTLLRWRQISSQDQKKEPWPNVPPTADASKLVAAGDFLYTLQREWEWWKTNRMHNHKPKFSPKYKYGFQGTQ